MQRRSEHAARIFVRTASKDRLWVLVRGHGGAVAARDRVAPVLVENKLPSASGQIRMTISAVTGGLRADRKKIGEPDRG